MGQYYKSAYQRRLNRYGLDYQSRIQKQREQNFDNYLYKTIYRVDFEFENDLIPASLERYKQDYSETQAYLLTRVDVKLPSGTIIFIQSKDDTTTPWMVWWLEQIEASGYNRYVVLKMTHYLKWNVGEEKNEQWAYFSGPGASTISETIKSANGKPLYKENNNLHMFITTYTKAISKDLYFEVVQGDTVQGYVIKELDINSTPGVGYVSVDPVPLRSNDNPKKNNTNAEIDSFWINGGVK